MANPQAQRAKARAAAFSVGSNTTLVAAKGIVGLATGSISILSEALHSAMDLLAAVMAYVAVRTSGRPPDEQHRYGHGKFESLSGTVEGLLVIGAAVLIAWKAVPALLHGHELEATPLAMGAMGGSALVNIVVSRHLYSVARRTHSLALEADALHLSTDVYSCLVVLAGLVVVRVTGLTLLDPLMALGVAGLIAWEAGRLIRRGLTDLVDASLPREERMRIIGILNEHRSLGLGFHELRCRPAGPYRHVDLHLELPRTMTVERAHELCDHLEQEIAEAMPGSRVLIHVEPSEQESESHGA